MKTKIGYYPMLDVVLLARQLFSVERYKPFSAPLEVVDSKLSKEEKETIGLIAPLTHDWLDVVQNIIDITMEGITSPEEFFIMAYKDPQRIFGSTAQKGMVTLLSDLWYNHCSAETSKYSNQIRKKAMEISELPSKDQLIDYILGLSDRLERVGNDTLSFKVKPELSVNINEIENIILMPSVFSSRNVAFWHSGNTYLFYIGLESKVMSLEEPSDMLLLRTLALNDRTRLKMLKSLTLSAYSVNDMAERMNVNASTVSRHFKVFKDAGFVDIQSQEGNSIYYSINENEMKKAMQSIYNYIFKGDGQ